MKKDTLVLLSGGIDSAHMLDIEHERVGMALFVDYGQPALATERVAAAKIAAFFGVELSTGRVTLKSRMGGGYSIVPMRNATLISLAINHAADLGLARVTYGAILDDVPIYADCTPQFVAKISYLACAFGVRVEAPVMRYTKAEIAKAVRPELIGLTWSCYKGGHLPCGECGSCKGVADAFSR